MLIIRLSAAVAQDSLLEQLQLNAVPLAPDALNGLADALLLRRLCTLTFEGCRLGPESVPALALILDGGCVVSLHISNGGFQMLDAATGEAFAAAIRTSNTLQSIHLEALSFWRDEPSAVAGLRALTAHPAVREVSLASNGIYGHENTVAGPALGTLLGANAPALQVLDVSYCHFGDEVFAPLVEALRRSTHLRTLRCGGPWMMSDEFAEGVFLDAVRDNVSLRELDASTGWSDEYDDEDSEDPYVPECVYEAEELVKARNNGE